MGHSCVSKITSTHTFFLKGEKGYTMNNVNVIDVDEEDPQFNDGDAVIVVRGKYAGNNATIIMFHTVKYTVRLQIQRIDVCLHPSQLRRPVVTVPHYRFLPNNVSIAIDTIVVALDDSVLDHQGRLHAIDHIRSEIRKRLDDAEEFPG
jgi:hypothetical protein